MKKTNIFFICFFIFLLGPELQDFNEEDIEKIQKDDRYVWKFLTHKDKDVDRALEMMVRNFCKKFSLFTINNSFF